MSLITESNDDCALGIHSAHHEVPLTSPRFHPSLFSMEVTYPLHQLHRLFFFYSLAYADLGAIVIVAQVS